MLAPMIRLPALAAAALLLLSACGGEEPSGGAAAKQDRPVVVVTTTQLGDLTREVAGTAADVHQILQPNSDPHEYEARPDDIKATAGAAS